MLDFVCFFGLNCFYYLSHLGYDQDINVDTGPLRSLALQITSILTFISSSSVHLLPLHYSPPHRPDQHTFLPYAPTINCSIPQRNQTHDCSSGTNISVLVIPRYSNYHTSLSLANFRNCDHGGVNCSGSTPQKVCSALMISRDSQECASLLKKSYLNLFINRKELHQMFPTLGTFYFPRSQRHLPDFSAVTLL